MASQQLQPSNPFDTPAPSLAGLNAESGITTPNTPANDQTLLAPGMQSEVPATEKTAVDPRRSSRTKWILVGAGAFIVAIIVIIVPVYFTVIKPKNTSSEDNVTSSSSSGNTSSPNPPPDVHSKGNTTGGDGSIVFTATGNFTYKNPFGGFWVYDPKDPFNNGAKAQVRTQLGSGAIILTHAPPRA
jgi:glucan 1,3-beta-glucosidase